MTYHFTTRLSTSFDNAVASTKEVLSRHHFHVISGIDMQEGFKKNLDRNFHPYLIIGACNPELSYRSLEAEDKIGTLLPCNVVVQQREPGIVEVSAVDPVRAMEGAHVIVNQIARQISADLNSVIEEVASKERGLHA